MSTRPLVVAKPTTDAAWVRDADQRLRALESKTTARVGEWVLSSVNGRLRATKPGESLEVGAAEPIEIDLTDRGNWVTKDDLDTALQEDRDGLIAWFEDHTGIDLSSVENLADLLADLIGGCLDLGQLAQLLGLPDVDLEAPPTLAEIRDWLNDRWTGVVDLSRIPRLPWAHLVGGDAELLTDPSFDAEDFDNLDPAITYDPTVGRLRPGSRRIALDGADHVMVSNLIAVEQGQKLPMLVWLHQEGVVASGSWLTLAARAYHHAADGGRTLLETVVLDFWEDAGSSDGLPGEVDGWVKLDGVYTVPAPIGGLTVDEVVLEIKVLAAGAAGTVWVDDASVTITRDGLPQAWVLDLLPDLAGLGNTITTTIDTILIALGITPMGSIVDRLFDLEDVLSDLQGTADDAMAAASDALADLADKLGIADWDDWLAEQWDDLRSKLATDPGSVLGQLGMGKITGLLDWNTAQQQINALLSGDLFITPVNSLVSSVKDWAVANTNKTSLLTGAGKLDKTNVLGLQVALDGAGQDIRDAIVQAMGGSGTGHTSADVFAHLSSIPAEVVQSGIAGATTIDDAVQKLLDSAIEGIGDLVGGGWGWNDLIAQLRGQSQAVAAANAAAVNLQAQVTELNPSASSEVVNFAEFVNSSAPPSMFTKVNDIGSGFLKTSGGQLVWDGSSAGREFYLFNGGPLQTNLFEVTFVLPAVPSHGWLGDDSSNFVYLIGRSDAAASNMVLCRAGWDELRFYSYNSGVFTQLGGGVERSDILTSGCSVSFKGGTVLDERYFEAKVNGTKVYNTTDTAPVTMLGSDYRYCGVGVEKGSSYSTGKISTWSMMDGGASAGSGVVSGHTVSGLTNLGIWRGTRSHYDAIITKNPNWVYVVRD